MHQVIAKTIICRYFSTAKSALLNSFTAQVVSQVLTNYHKTILSIFVSDHTFN